MWKCLSGVRISGHTGACRRGCDAGEYRDCLSGARVEGHGVYAVEQAGGCAGEREGVSRIYDVRGVAFVGLLRAPCQRDSDEGYSSAPEGGRFPSRFRIRPGKRLEPYGHRFARNEAGRASGAAEKRLARSGRGGERGSVGN